MKICLLNDSFPPAVDGVVNVVLNYADNLRSSCGAGVVVGTPAYPGADYSAYPYRVVPYQSFDTTAVASGYRTGNPFSGKPLEELVSFGPDLIHTHCPASSTILARLLRERTGAPIILTYHTKYDTDIRRVLRFPPAAEEAIRAMVANIEACDEVWVVSRGAGENLRSLGYQGDYRVMNNGVDFERGRVSPEEVSRVTMGFDLPEGVPVFLFVGRMMTYKGIPMILDALKLLTDEGMDFRMVFIGKGPDLDAMEKKALALGLNGGPGPDRCIFTGAIYDREVLRAWNTRADLFLFPSTFDTNGLVVREAAACGLACVLIEGSCAAEGIIDGRNGYLIRESPEAMASLLAAVCRDLPALRLTGMRAMKEIYLSWETCVRKAYERYGEILEEKRAGRLPARGTLPADRLVALTARGMKEAERQRRVRRELFDDFRDTAVGMAENVQEAERSFSVLLDRFRESLRESVDPRKRQ